MTGCWITQGDRAGWLAPAAQVRETFSAWQAALAPPGHRERRPGGGTTWLHAAARRRQVKVALTATVFDGEEDDL